MPVTELIPLLNITVVPLTPLVINGPFVVNWPFVVSGPLDVIVPLITTFPLTVTFPATPKSPLIVSPAASTYFVSAFAVITYRLSKSTVDVVSTCPNVSNVCPFTTFPLFNTTSDTDDVSICPIVIVPAPFVIPIPTPAFNVAIVGVPLPSPINNCPFCNTAVDKIWPVPPPTNIPPSVNDVLPVPPFGTVINPAKLPKFTLTLYSPDPSPTKYFATTLPLATDSSNVLPTNNRPGVYTAGDPFTLPRFRTQKSAFPLLSSA